MKTILCAALLLLAGCTSTEFSMGTCTVKRTSFLTKTGIGEVSISTNGTARMIGYEQAGDAAMASAIAEGAAKGAVAGARGLP
jgi:hypothetical protein